MKSSISQNRKTKGFSLIEILAAFTIASVALAIIFQIYSNGTSAGILGAEYTRALAIAESRLELISTVESLDNYIPSGIEIDRYFWEIVIDDYIPEGSISDEPRIELKVVTVTVSWDSRGRERSVTLQTLKPHYPT